MKTMRRILALLAALALLACALCAGAEPLSGEAGNFEAEQAPGEPAPIAEEPDTTPSESPDQTEAAPGEPTGEPEATDAPLPSESAAPEPTEAGPSLSGTTSPVDDSTTLPDGEYTPEGFSFSGGTGKTTIECVRVTVRGGRSSATIRFSSKSYVYVKASGGKFDAEVVDGRSVVTIPVQLNADNRIIGMTRAMSKEQEIEYTIRVTLTGTQPQETPSPEETQAPGETQPPQLEDGDYQFGIESGFKMFRIASCTVKVSGGRLTVTLVTDGTTYDRIYLGSKDDADRSGFIQGTLNGAGTGYVFSFELPSSRLGAQIDFVPGKPDGTWYEKNQYALTIPAAPGERLEESEPDEPGEAGEDYDIEVESSASMFKVVRAVLRVRDGKYSAVITLSGTGYDYLFMGTAEAAAAADASAYIPFAPDAEGKYTYEIPVARLGAPIDVAAHSVKNDTWYDRQLTFRSAAQPEPGDYEAGVESSSSMFKVVRAVLTAKGGAYTAVITLSGTGYDRLYMGAAAEAATADAGAIIPFAPDAEGRYTFAIPVPALDVPIVLAAHSAKKDEWYDRTLTFRSDALVRIGEGEPEPTASPSPSPTPGPSQTPEADLSGSTGRVDSSTALADGTYTPDRFTCSGGTGRVTISCSRVTVRGGKATATIVFSSTTIGYVKANGQKYYPSVSGGSSSFEIPVKLNANNRIIGMTTAMSQDHEVEYTIYIYLAAAEQGASGADEGAPEVMGLRYISKDALDAARKFAIYRYEGGIAVIEVEGAGGYLVADAGAELPAGIEEEFTVIRRPVESAYAATPEIYAMIEALNDPAALAAVKLAGYEGALTYGGSYDAPDYAALLAGGCDLALVPGSFADARVRGRTGEADAWLDANLSDADAASLADVAGRFDLLGIPLFADRSGDEESEAARLEWIKAYGVLFDCEQAASAAYAAAVAALGAPIAA